VPVLNCEAFSRPRCNPASSIQYPASGIESVVRSPWFATANPSFGGSVVLPATPCCPAGASREGVTRAKAGSLVVHGQWSSSLPAAKPLSHFLKLRADIGGPGRIAASLGDQTRLELEELKVIFGRLRENLFVYNLDLLVDYLPGKPVYSPRAPSNVAPLRQTNDSHQAPHWINGWVMGVSEILEEIKSLPMQQRWEILERTREMLGEEIPESFKQGMREIAGGEVIELDEALEELEQPQ
jgi:hypothetical protein